MCIKKLQVFLQCHDFFCVVTHIYHHYTTWIRQERQKRDQKLTVITTITFFKDSLPNRAPKNEEAFVS